MTNVAISKCVAAALTLGAIAGPANAQTSYDPFADVISAEILPGWQMEDGRRMVGLRLEMAPGWKTYWRAPGDAGIPPLFNWSRARNVQGVEISWPTPKVTKQNGMRSIGYADVVTIPMTITPKSKSKPVRLRGRMDLGVCSDVCMPHTLTFDATINNTGSRPTPSIAAALADTPYSAKEAGVTSAVCAIRPDGEGMAISATIDLPHTGGREETVIEPGLTGVWISEPKTTRSGDTLTTMAYMSHQDGGAFSINRSAVRITVLGSEYAVDIQGCTGR